MVCYVHGWKGVGQHMPILVLKNTQRLLLNKNNELTSNALKLEVVR